MKFHDTDGVARYYAEAHARHGDAPEAVGWGTCHGQLASFIALARTEGLGEGVTVLDLGCGLGDLLRFLRRRGFEVDYTGWDICEPLIERARELHPDARFEVRDILADPPAEPFDFVLCSGALNMAIPDHDAWLAQMIRAMFAACRRGLAFTLLSAAWAERNPEHTDTETYFYARPGAVLELALSLSPQVVLDHAEMAHIFAVHLYRGNRAPADRLREATTAGETYDDGHEAVVEQLVALGLLEEAIAHLEGLAPSAAGYQRVAEIAFSLGDDDRMQAALERAELLRSD